MLTIDDALMLLAGFFFFFLLKGSIPNYTKFHSIRNTLFKTSYTYN